MISVRNVTYRAGGRNLLQNISFETETGRFLAILGANGAGKTTLMKLMSGDKQSAAGEVFLHGKNVQSFSVADLAKRRAVLLQHNTVSLSFRVEDIVMMGRYPFLNTCKPAYNAAIVHKVMAETGITTLKNRSYTRLSGGEQQRVQLARVMAQIYDQPGACLFLDEPTNGLDLLYQQQILQMARSLANRDYCVVSILHDINFAARFADDILLLKGGQMIAHGLAQNVITAKNIKDAYQVDVRLVLMDGCPYPAIIPCDSFYPSKI